jgi:hypothetical protein
MRVDILRCRGHWAEARESESQHGILNFGRKSLGRHRMSSLTVLWDEVVNRNIHKKPKRLPNQLIGAIIQTRRER